MSVTLGLGGTGHGPGGGGGESGGGPVRLSRFADRNARSTNAAPGLRQAALEAQERGVPILIDAESVLREPVELEGPITIAGAAPGGQVVPGCYGRLIVKEALPVYAIQLRARHRGIFAATIGADSFDFGAGPDPVTRIAGVEGAAVGDRVRIVSDDQNLGAEAGKKRGEFARVAAVDGGDILCLPIRDSYPTNPRVLLYGRDRIAVHGLLLENDPALLEVADAKQGLLRVVAAPDPLFGDLEFRNGTRAGLWLMGCFAERVRDCRFYRGINSTATGQPGYGGIVSCGGYGRWSGCWFEDWRHGFTTIQPTTFPDQPWTYGSAEHTEVESSDFLDCTNAGADWHGDARFCRFLDVRVWGGRRGPTSGRLGVQLRGEETSVVDALVYGCRVVSVGNQPGEVGRHRIVDTEVRAPDEGITISATAAPGVPVPDTTITDGLVVAPSGQAIRFDGEAELTLDGLRVRLDGATRVLRLNNQAPLRPAGAVRGAILVDNRGSRADQVDLLQIARPDNLDLRVDLAGWAWNAAVDSVVAAETLADIVGRLEVRTLTPPLEPGGRVGEAVPDNIQVSVSGVVPLSPLSLGATLAGWWSMQGSGVVRDSGDDSLHEAELAAVLATPPTGDYHLARLDDLSGRGRHFAEPVAGAQLQVVDGALAFASGRGATLAHQADFDPSSGVWWYLVVDLPAGANVGGDHLLGKGHGIDGPAGYHFNWTALDGGDGALTVRATHDAGATVLNGTAYFATPRPRILMWLGFEPAADLLHHGSLRAGGRQGGTTPLAAAAAAYDNALPVRLGGAIGYIMDGGAFREAIALVAPSMAQRSAVAAYLRSKWSV
jgi:hypothetical protein